MDQPAASSNQPAIVLAYASPRGIGRVNIEAVEGWATVTIRPVMRPDQWILLLLTLLGLMIFGAVLIVTIRGPRDQHYESFLVASSLGVGMCGWATGRFVNRVGRRIIVVARDGGLEFRIVRRIGYEEKSWPAGAAPTLRVEETPPWAYLVVDWEGGNTERLLQASNGNELLPVVEALWRGLKQTQAAEPLVGQPTEGKSV